MSQYITLPSNSSVQYFPQNSLTQFKTKLAKQIIHDESKWEVALAEISFPKTWVNVKPDENEIYVENNFNFRCLTIPVKRYANNFEFFHALKECFTFEKHLGVSVAFNEKTGHIVFESPNGSVLYLTGKLALQIGFKSDVVLADNENINSTVMTRHSKLVITGKRITPPNPVNVNLGYDILYVYTDCIEQQLVGDVQAQLLHSIYIKNNSTHAMQTISFESPHYIPVARRNFDIIEINIRDESGEKVPSQFGRVVVKLHFRLRRQLLF